MLVLREADYVAAPWKNGGGVTREIFREPRDGEDFDWRLSLATIDVPGPFSVFAGYARTLVLVRGAGVDIAFDQHEGARLAQAGELLNFDGAWTASCKLLSGPSTDLNFMVQRARVVSDSRCLRVTAPEAIQTSPWLQTFVCCISGSVRLAGARGYSELRTVDTACCTQTDQTLTCHSLGSQAALIFVAQVKRA